MTWDEICALDEEALNVAIEQLEGRRWQHDVLWPAANEYPRAVWRYTDANGHNTWSTVPHLHTTASWDATMALAWRYGIGLAPTNEPGVWLIWKDHLRGIPEYAAEPAHYATTQEDARRTICLLALYVAQQTTNATPAQQ